MCFLQKKLYKCLLCFIMETCPWICDILYSHKQSDVIRLFPYWYLSSALRCWRGWGRVLPQCACAKIRHVASFAHDWRFSRSLKKYILILYSYCLMFMFRFQFNVYNFSISNMFRLVYIISTRHVCIFQFYVTAFQFSLDCRSRGTFKMFRKLCLKTVLNQTLLVHKL